MSGQRTLIQRVTKTLDAVQTLCILIASVALVVLIVTFGWLVFTRYVLNDSATWVEQLSLLLICYIVFLGAAAGVRADTHLGVTVFRSMLPVVLQKIVILLIDFVIAGFGAIIVWVSIPYVMFGWDSLIPLLNIPESFRTSTFGILGALVFLFAGSRLVLRLLTFKDWDPDTSPLEQTS